MASDITPDAFLCRINTVKENIETYKWATKFFYEYFVIPKNNFTTYFLFFFIFSFFFNFRFKSLKFVKSEVVFVLKEWGNKKERSLYPTLNAVDYAEAPSFHSTSLCEWLKRKNPPFCCPANQCPSPPWNLRYLSLLSYLGYFIPRPISSYASSIPFTRFYVTFL